MNIHNKFVLITGGARMGHTIAMALAKRGAHVALTYRKSKKSAEQSVAEVRSLNRKSFSVQADLAKPDGPKRIMGVVRKKFGKLHALVNMASIYEHVGLRALQARDWDRNIQANLKAAYDLSLMCAPLMRKSGGGRIINLSDWTAASGRPRYKGLLPYYVAKSGTTGLTEALALELAPSILVNALAPGPILPPPGLKRRERQEVVKGTPLRKWGGVEEIAKAVLFLIESDFVTGETIRIDGGRHLY